MIRLKVETPNDRDILFTRTFNAPAQLVFDAHTKPELVRQWLLGPEGWTMPVCEIDLRVGGKFRYVWRREATNSDMGMGGTYHEIAAPGRIVHTELFDDDWTEGETNVTTLFDERDGKTFMRMTVRYSSAKARDGAMATGMVDGMEAGYARLDTLVAT